MRMTSAIIIFFATFTLFLHFGPSSATFAPGGQLKVPIVQHHRNVRRAEGGGGAVKLNILQVELYGQISVGTPPQTLDVVFNQVSNDFWLANDNFTHDPRLSYPEHQFKHSKSSTFQPNGSHYAEGYFSATGVIGKDIIRFGDLETVSQFGMVDRLNSFFYYTKVYDAMFGLSIDKVESRGRLTIPRSLDLIADKLEKPIFTIWTESLVAPDKGVPVPGQITFGSEDPEHCQSDFAYVPLDDAWRLWASLHSIELVRDGVAIGQWEMPEGKRSVWFPMIGKEYKYGPTKEGISGPADIVREIGTHFEVKWNTEKEWEAGEMACSSATPRPDIVLNIGTKLEKTVRWVMRPEDYTIKTNKNKWFGQNQQKCFFLFHSWGDSWSFNTLFMNRWCTAYNFAEQTIGFGHKK